MAAARTGDPLLRALAAWAEHDEARALHPSDVNVIRSTEPVRSLVLELFEEAAHARDLFNAAARLGALMADSGASPSLAAGAIDNAVRALADAGVRHDGGRVHAARSSLLEGYVGSVRDAERAAALATWEHPSCAVALEDGRVAIACGLPTDDPEAASAWAARIAGHLTRAGVKRAVLSGDERARAEVESALAIVGIAVEDPAAAPKRSWLRLPWT